MMSKEIEQRKERVNHKPFVALRMRRKIRSMTEDSLLKELAFAKGEAWEPYSQYWLEELEAEYKRRLGT
jgi:hypothetical protein